MKIFDIRGGRPAKSALEKTAEVLKQGGVILYPTETAYALGCDAKNSAAVARIARIKKRPQGKPFPLIAGSEAMVRRLCKVNAESARLMRRYWPGPLTLVLDVRRGDASVAVRVSGSDMARAISVRLGRPIVSTSANRSGQPSCYSVRSALRQLRGQAIDVILDAGALPRRKTSTITDARKEKIRIVRQGVVYF